MRNMIAAVALTMLWQHVALAADEPRKIDFGTVLMDLDDEPMTECADETPPPPGQVCRTKKQITLGMLASRALCAAEQGVAADEAFKRCQLGTQVYKSRGAALTAEEVASIKKQINRVFGSPLIVLRTFTLLDPVPPK